MAALGALELSNTNVGFDSEGTAMVPVSSGKNKLGEIKIKSPLDTFKDTFADMRDSLAAMLGIQTKEAKRQAHIDAKLLAQKDFEIKQLNEKFAREDRQGPLLPTSDDFEGVDTDKKRKTNIEAFEGSALAGLLDTLKDSFEKVSFGEKMTAILLAGGLFLFLKFKEQLITALTPVTQFVMDLVDSFGAAGVFGMFIGTMILFKLGIAQFLLKFAAGGIIKGFALLGTKIKAAGGLMFLAGKGAGKLGNGIKAMNSGLKTVVSKIGGAGSIITGGLTKGFTLLGRGLTGLRLGIMSMSGSLGAMLVPFLPVIAIAAGVVAVLYSLKSGFEVFKKSLDDGDSMLVAIGKGIADFALTLATLPITLVKKLVGFVAGIFGFDGIKEALDKFSFKDFIKKSFASFIGSFVRVIKAIAKGAAAALAAIAPGGKTPQGEFSRVYNEVMEGGAGQPKIEKSDLEKTGTDGEPKLTETKVADAIVNDEIPLPAPMKSNMLGALKDVVVGDRYKEGTVAYERVQKFKKDQALKRENAKMREIEQFNKRGVRKLDPEAMYTEITDNSSKIINKTEVIEAPLEVNNNEAFQRFINTMGSRYGNSF